MSLIIFTTHARLMLSERNLSEEWIWRTIRTPDDKKTGPEGNTHYIKAISERDNRYLRVVVNERVEPHRIVTMFFDRRLRRRQ